jgi:NADPH2:quinone reductase
MESICATLTGMHALIPSPAPSPTVELADVAEPELRPDEVVVAVAAFSVNRGETFLLERPHADWRPGKDVAGVVVREAADGRGPRVGERVVAHPRSAGWAERVAVAVDSVAVLPDAVSFASAAALPLAGLTALRLVRVTGSLASRRVLLTGASGGVGHYFVELAAAQGAVVTAVSASAERGARLTALGAAAVVSSIDDAEGPFDIALDGVGGETTATAWSKLGARGLLVWFGQAGRVPPTLDFFDWRGGGSGTIRKFDYTDSDTSDAEDLATLVRLVEAGRLHPEIGLVADWAQTNETLAALLARSIRGNAVLTIADKEIA